jgi:hypothetical protein
MSAEFVNGISQELISYQKVFWGNRQDTVINIDGLNPTAGDGVRLNITPDIQQWISQRPFITNVGNWKASLDGSKDTTKLVADIRAYIEECYDPRGQLIITGRSRGGMNALQLCRELAGNCSYFQIRKLSTPITDDEPKGKFSANPLDNTPFTVKVRIDLICIMDATFDVNGFDRQRKFPGMVRSYRNWYQTKEGNGGKHGELFPTESSSTVKIMDENCNGRLPPLFFGTSHDFVCDKIAQPEATKLIETMLGSPTPQLTPNLLNMPSPQPPHRSPGFRVRR